MGEKVIDSISGTDTLSVKCNTIYPQARDEALTAGPEGGWKFARRRYSGIDDERFAVTAIAQNGTDITVTATHTLAVGDMAELDNDTGYGGTYDVTAISGTSSFDVTATFVATGTGFAYWRSEDYAYRYLIPTSPTILSIESAGVAGVELTDWVREGDYILTNLEDAEIDISVIQQITDTTKFPPWFTKVVVLKMAIELTYNLTQDLNIADRLERELDQKIMPKAMAMDEREKYVKEESTAWADMGHTQEIIE
jgi:hypothetical protein